MIEFIIIIGWKYYVKTIRQEYVYNNTRTITLMCLISFLLRPIEVNEKQQVDTVHYKHLLKITYNKS